LISLDRCSLLQLSEPQPAVESCSEITEFTNSSYGSRLPEPKRQQAAAVQGGKFLAQRGLIFYQGDKKKRAILPPVAFRDSVDL